MAVSGLKVEEDKTAKAVASGSGAAALCGIGAIVLTILGLCRILPVDLCAIAVIAAGAGLAFQGGAVAGRYHDALRQAQAGRRDEVELTGGITAELTGGIAGIVLGILALVGVDPLDLLPIAAIALGGSLLLGSASAAPLNEMPLPPDASGEVRRASRYAVSSAIGADVLVGLGAITLGILGLIGVAHDTIPILSLIAFLSLGAAELLTGSALGTRMAAIFRH